MNISDFFFWVFCFLLFDVRTPVDGGVLAPTRRVFARPGAAAVLPCRLRPRRNATAFTVEWSKEDGGGRHYINIYRRGTQRGAVATSLFLDRLGDGDISLELLNVTAADGGTYRCAVPRLGGGGPTAATVELVVAPDYVHVSTTTPPSAPPPRGSAATDPTGPGPKSKMAAVAAVTVFLVVVTALTFIIIIKHRLKLQKQDSLKSAAGSCWTRGAEPEAVLKVFLDRG